jgi:hypothetical protein
VKPLLDLLIDDCLYSVTVGIKNEGGKIIRTVFRVESHPTIVVSALFKRLIESGHSLSLRRAKGDMETLAWHDDSWGTKSDSKLIFSTGQAIANSGFLIARGGFMSPDADIAEKREGCIIKKRRSV